MPSNVTLQWTGRSRYPRPATEREGSPDKGGN